MPTCSYPSTPPLISRHPYTRVLFFRRRHPVRSIDRRVLISRRVSAHLCRLAFFDFSPFFIFFLFFPFRLWFLKAVFSQTPDRDAGSDCSVRVYIVAGQIGWCFPVWCSFFFFFFASPLQYLPVVGIWVQYCFRLFSRRTTSPFPPSPRCLHYFFSSYLLILRTFQLDWYPSGK